MSNLNVEHANGTDHSSPIEDVRMESPSSNAIDSNASSASLGRSEGVSSSSHAATCIDPTAAPTTTKVKPPLTPIRETRKRSFTQEDGDDGTSDIDAAMQTDIIGPTEPVLTTPTTIEPSVHIPSVTSRASSPSNRPPSAASSVSIATSSSPSCSSPSPSPAAIPSKPFWPWYLVTAVGGCPNADYADFVPSKSFFDPLPDIGETDWWGLGSSDSVSGSVSVSSITTVVTSSSGEGPPDGIVRIHANEELKIDTEQKTFFHEDDTLESDSSSNNSAIKRQRLSDSSMTSSTPSPSSSPCHRKLSSNSFSSNLFGGMGQDSYFSVSNSLIGCAVLGVADGVGGWREYGIDSGEISRAIMKAARDIAVRQCTEAVGKKTDTSATTVASPLSPGATSPSSHSDPSKSSFTLNPSDILTRAYLETKRAGRVEAGSTTACIVALTPVPMTVVAEIQHINDTLIDDVNHATDHSTMNSHEIPAGQTLPSSSTLTSDDFIPPTAATLFTSSSPLFSNVSDLSHAMFDLKSAMIDTNLTVIATQVGHAHINGTQETSIASSVSASTLTNSMEDDTHGYHATSAPIDIPLQPTPNNAIDNVDTIDSDTNGSTHNDSNPPGLIDTAHPSLSTIVPPPSSTSSLASDSVYLSAANLGDSGYMILRKDTEGVFRVVHMSDFQRTGRTIKQLAIIPPRFANDSYCDDSPSEAALDAYLVKENDFVVLASDGLWDNLVADDWMPMWSFFGGQEGRAERRKARMCASVETIASECAELIASKRVQVSNANDVGTAAPPSDFDIPLSIDPSLQVRSAALASASASALSPLSPSSADVEEVQIFADRLKEFALNFMLKPVGKPDDLTIVVSKVKRMRS